MNRTGRQRPRYADVTATIALVVALGGGAWAAKQATIGAGDIKDDAVRSEHIKKKNVESSDLATKAVTKGKLGGGAVVASKIVVDAVDDTKISDYEVMGDSLVRLTATAGADEATARAAAPETELFAAGQARVYAKCYHDDGTDTTFGTVYAETSADGAISQGLDNLPGGNAATDFLNSTTLEDDREVDEESATGADAEYSEAENALATPDGTSLHYETAIAVKNGALAGGNGIYGEGNVCLFQGAVFG